MWDGRACRKFSLVQAVNVQNILTCSFLISHTVSRIVHLQKTQKCVDILYIISLQFLN